VLRTCLAAVASLAILAAPATCAVIEVDVAGGGDFTTISEGVAAADDGDTVLVAPGTYMGPLNRGIHGVGGITLTSESGPGVTVVDCENEDFAFSVAGGGILDGFTIRRGDGYAINGYTAVFMCSMTGLATVSNCIFTDNVGTGLLTYGNNSVLDCVFLDHGGTSVRIEPGGQTILSGCIFENGIGPGLFFYNEWYGDGHPPHEVLDCVFRGIGGWALVAWWESPLVEECLFVDNNGPALLLNSSSAIVRDCTIVSNHSTSSGAFAFSLSGHHSAQNSCTISNCIVAFNSCAGSVSGRPDYSVFDLNCFFENAGGDSLVSRTASRSNIFVDPLLCNYTGGDYTLCENSPCLTGNEPEGVAMGAYADAPGCGPCSSPVNVTSWGAIKALYR
jgi:hypothetical protein